MRAIRWIRSLTAVLAFGLLAMPVWAASAPATAPVQGVWVTRQVHFVYQGFTTYFSCGGLRDEIDRMLTKLGARALKLREDPCVRPGFPDPFPGVHVKMQVLVPADTHVPAASRVAAHWQKVVLTRSGADFNQGGKCELVGQFRRVFLPLFAARHIVMHSTCVPHQIMMGTYLSAEVLVPDRAAPARH